MEGVALQTVVGQLLLQHGNSLLRHRLAHKGDGELLFHFVDAALDQLGVGKDKLAFQVMLYVAVHDGIIHRHAADEDAGDHRDDGDGQNDAVDFFLPLGADLPVGRYSQQHRHQRGGQGDKQGVDGEEVKCTQQETGLQGGKAVACGTERGHQRRGDGHAGDHIPLFLPGVADHAGKAAEEGDEYVPDGGACAGDHLRRGLLQGRQQKIEGGGDQADGHLGAEAGQRPAHEGQVLHRQGVAQSEYAAHQRRNEHGADNDGGGVYVQADGGDENGQHQNPHVGAVNGGVLQHHGVDLLIAHHVAPDIQQLTEIGLGPACLFLFFHPCIPPDFPS